MPSPIMQMFDRRQTRDIAIASTNGKIKGTRRRDGENEMKREGGRGIKREKAKRRKVES